MKTIEDYRYFVALARAAGAGHGTRPIRDYWLHAELVMYNDAKDIVWC